MLLFQGSEKGSKESDHAPSSNVITFPDWLYSIAVSCPRNQVKSPDAGCHVTSNAVGDTHPTCLPIRAKLNRLGCQYSLIAHVALCCDEDQLTLLVHMQHHRTGDSGLV
jgi:hypothetical protein